MIDFIAGFAVGVLCVFGALGLFASLLCAAWRDGMLRYLNGIGQWRD